MTVSRRGGAGGGRAAGEDEGSSERRDELLHGSSLIRGPVVDDDVGRFDAGGGHDARGEAQFVDGFGADQGHDAEGSALEFDLAHDGVGDDSGHESAELVAGAGVLGSARVARQVLRELGQPDAVDDAASGLVRGRLEASGVDPAAQGVVADVEELGGVADPIMRHGQDNITASAANGASKIFAGAARRCGSPGRSRPCRPRRGHRRASGCTVMVDASWTPCPSTISVCPWRTVGGQTRVTAGLASRFNRACIEVLGIVTELSVTTGSTALTLTMPADDTVSR